MFATYLRRELRNRTRQTVLVAIGMALAIALVIVVSSISAGVRNAQAAVLESIYGVGTDLTVTAPPAGPGQGGPGGLFQFEEGDGSSTESGSTELSQSRLTAEPMTGLFDESTLDTVTGTDGVAAATGTLELVNMTFSGEIPAIRPDQPMQAPLGGGDTDENGGSSFEVDTFSVNGVDVDGDAVGPLSAMELVDGRALEASDAGEHVAVLDAAYAESEDLAVGDTIQIDGVDFEVVGVVTSASADAETAANAYIPLDVAQSLSGQEGMLSAVYVQATDASSVAQLADDLQAALPDAEVNTEEDLASTVSGSLASAAELVSNLGTWLAVAALAAAFALAVLFTLSGVARRTREFGTLKAIGWSNGRIVRQVAGESLVQGLLGGVAGIALGLGIAAVIGAVAPTLTASTGATGLPEPTVQGGGGGDVVVGGPMVRPDFAASSAEVTLTPDVAVGVLLLAVGLAILGGVLAGAIGGWRAARLRPAEALRSVA